MGVGWHAHPPWYLYIFYGRYFQSGTQTSKRTRSNYLTMPIVVNVDVMLARRKMQSKDLAEKLDITPANLSILKTGKAKGIRFDTLDAICKILDCQPGDVLEYIPN